MRAFVSVKCHFSAAHRLFNASWTMEENERVFGICNNPNGHGHNYTLEVTVQGPVPEGTGMVTDMKQLKEIVEEAVVRRVDHKHLNLDVPFLAGVIPTAENLAASFWNVLEPLLPEGRLYEVRLCESDRNAAFVRR